MRLQELNAALRDVLILISDAVKQKENKVGFKLF
jgi:hypothetical protein